MFDSMDSINPRPLNVACPKIHFNRFTYELVHLSAYSTYIVCGALSCLEILTLFKLTIEYIIY